jgi:hypothetical protein
MTSNYAGSRLEIVVGLPEGLSGNVDERLQETRTNLPKGFTVDDGGNIVDAMNLAIGNISGTGKLKISHCRVYHILMLWS